MQHQLLPKRHQHIACRVDPQARRGAPLPDPKTGFQICRLGTDLDAGGISHSPGWCT
jgi:hypothetical protein